MGAFLKDRLPVMEMQFHEFRVLRKKTKLGLWTAGSNHPRDNRNSNPRLLDWQSFSAAYDSVINDGREANWASENRDTSFRDTRNSSSIREIEFRLLTLFANNMNDVYLACRDCQDFVDVGYRWAYCTLEESGIVNSKHRVDLAGIANATP